MSTHGNFELVRLRSGATAVRHKGHDEVMHPDGPWHEANRLYVDHTRLRERLSRPGGALHLLDVGLGAAANATAALACLESIPQAHSRHLRLTSFETERAALELAVEGRLDYLAPWEAAVRTLLAEGTCATSRFTWTLLEGDVRARLADAGPPAEVVFFDPFSPRSNPELWAAPALEQLRGRLTEDAVLATYSAATPTRVSLLLAGFFVGEPDERVKGTLATTRLDGLSRPLGPRWLQRWERSSARAPHGQSLTPQAEAAVRGHPQWQTYSP